MFDRDFLIYLDTEFVVRKYEDVKDVTPATTITKTEDVSADVGFLGLKAGAVVREARSYSLSSWRMLQDIWPELEKYAKFNGAYSLRPQWFKGHLGVGQSENIRTSGSSREKLGEHWYFELRLTDGSLPLFTKQQYFTSGYDQILSNVHGLSTTIWIGVRVLAKVLFNNRTQDIVVAAPCLIFSTEKD